MGTFQNTLFIIRLPKKEIIQMARKSSYAGYASACNRAEGNTMAANAATSDCDYTLKVRSIASIRVATGTPATSLN